MKKMSLTMAFLIAMLIVLWFFGVTVFHFGPQAWREGDMFMANVLGHFLRFLSEAFHSL